MRSFSSRWPGRSPLTVPERRPGQRFLRLGGATHPHRERGFHADRPLLAQALPFPLPGPLIEQPADCGTGAAVFLPLVYILDRDPAATVMIFATTHFVYPEGRFQRYVTAAYRLAVLDAVRAGVAAPDRERMAVEHAYHRLPHASFARDLLASCSSVVCLTMDDVVWRDWERAGPAGETRRAIGIDGALA